LSGWGEAPLVVLRHAGRAESAWTAAISVEHLDVVAALNDLPLAQRRAIVLHDLDGMSVAEVAKEVGAPEGTVKSWLSRGRASIAEALSTRASAPPIKGRR
jgi:RNA polymerase sigma-70 factor (ECF subfamily)